MKKVKREREAKGLLRILFYLVGSTICYHPPTMASAEPQSLSHGSNNGLPPTFIHPQGDGPSKTRHTCLPRLLQLPVFDMAKFSDSDNVQERKSLALKVQEACKEWGVLHVVNHGVPLDAIRKVKELGLRFFAMPSEQKQKSRLDIRSGYEERKLDMGKDGPWLESLTMGIHPDSVVAEIADRVWPEPEPKREFVDAINEYNKCVADFSQKIWILLAESLGLEPNTFNRNLEEYRASFRFSFYPPCPDPSVRFGVTSHTDPNLITFIYQDDVGGLEIHHGEGEWIPVQPHEGAFVIFIGDSLQAWTNDIYRSVEHRVVTNPKRARLSVSFFVAPSRVIMINPLEKWVDEAHPLKYKTFNWRDFEEWVQESTMKGEKLAFKRNWLSRIVTA